MKDTTLYTIAFCVWIITIGFVAYFITPWVLLLYLFTSYKIEKNDTPQQNNKTLDTKE